MSLTHNEDDPSFLALSARLRHRIDGAFDSIASSGAQLQQSRLEASSGGFVVEDEAGGFIVEDLPSSSSDGQSHIPLSEIPRALDLLDLFPDEDIMGVFKNAATGWGAQDARSDGVSRKDWRAVCAALLEGEHVEGSEQENSVGDEDTEMGVDGDEYQSGDTEEASSDEYSEEAARPRKAQKGTTKSSEISRQLTEAQKAQCRQDFRGFFPHVPDNELDHQRIMIKDITRVAGLLKENLTTEEILQMLQAFSTAPDKSMNLTDFEHMMILTKLV